MADLVDLKSKRLEKARKNSVDTQINKYTVNDEQEELRQRIKDALMFEVKQRIRDLEADVASLAEQQKRMQKRLLLLIRHVFNLQDSEDA